MVIFQRLLSNVQFVLSPNTRDTVPTVPLYQVEYVVVISSPAGWLEGGQPRYTRNGVCWQQEERQKGRHNHGFQGNAGWTVTPLQRTRWTNNVLLHGLTDKRVVNDSVGDHEGKSNDQTGLGSVQAATYWVTNGEVNIKGRALA